MQAQQSKFDGKYYKSHSTVCDLLSLIHRTTDSICVCRFHWIELRLQWVQLIFDHVALISIHLFGTFSPLICIIDVNVVDGWNLDGKMLIRLVSFFWVFVAVVIIRFDVSDVLAKFSVHTLTWGRRNDSEWIRHCDKLTKSTFNYEDLSRQSLGSRANFAFETTNWIAIPIFNRGSPPTLQFGLCDYW